MMWSQALNSLIGVWDKSALGVPWEDGRDLTQTEGRKGLSFPDGETLGL